MNISKYIYIFDNKDHKEFSYGILLGLGILVCTILSSFLNVNTDVIVAIFFITYVLLWVIKLYSKCFLYVMLFFTAITNLIGVYVCEQTVWLNELYVVTTHSGGFPLLVLYYWIILQTVMVIDYYIENRFYSYSKEKVNNSREAFYFIIGVVLLGILLVMLGRALYYPISETGLNRFDYRYIYFPGLWGKINNLALRWIIPFCLSVILRYPGKLRILYLINISIYIIFSYNMGEKFSPYLYCFFMAAVAFSAWQGTAKWNTKIFLKSIGWMSSFAIIIVGMYFAQINSSNNAIPSKPITGNTEEIESIIEEETSKIALQENKSVEEIIDYVYNEPYFSRRIKQQGEVWWKLYTDNKMGPAHILEFTNEIKSCFPIIFGTLDHTEYGIYKVGTLIVPSSMQEIVSQKLSTFTETTPGTIYYYFKGPGLLIGAFLFGVLMVIVMRLLFNACRSMSFLQIIICTRLCVAFDHLLTSSEFSTFFDWITVCSFVILAFLYYIRTNKKLIKSERIQKILDIV